MGDDALRHRYHISPGFREQIVYSYFCKNIICIGRYFLYFLLSIKRFMSQKNYKHCVKLPGVWMNILEKESVQVVPSCSVISVN